MMKKIGTFSSTSHDGHLTSWNTSPSVYIIVLCLLILLTPLAGSFARD